MNERINRAFRDIKDLEMKGFIPFITACDPDPATTVDLIVELGLLGSTVIELGVPFTDPMADGPVIQRSSQRALEAGNADLGSILEIVRAAREKTDVPIILFGYMNPFFAYGLERLANEASEAGVDGFLITDVIDDEFVSLFRLFSSKDLDLISLVAPTTTDARIAEIADHANGFIYAVSRTGVTGSGADMRDSARELVGRVRRATELPVAVGFGIASADQVSDVLEFADAAVVGSAIVKIIEEAQGGPQTVDEVASFARRLMNGSGEAGMSG